MRICLFLLLCLASLPAWSAPLRVLFVGNSYTYTHNLPELFRRVAAAQGHPVSVRALTLPGAAIEDHFSVGHLPAALGEGWDLVVLQQGPSSLPENRRHLIHWSAEVARNLDPIRTRIVMYGVWPAQVHLHTWANAEISYASAAAKVDGCLFPAAAAWRLALEQPDLPALYSSDGLHPTREGAMLSALTLARTLWPRQHKALDGRLGLQFSESSWQPAVALAPRLDQFAMQAVAQSRPRCAE